MRFNTSLLHEGVNRREYHGATLVPICQSSAFEQPTAADLEKIFENKAPGYCYTRVGNPTITAFENRMTKLEHGISTIACASGMAALFNAITNIVGAGDEIISSASLYGGTIDLFRDLEAFGIKTHYVSNNHWEEIEAAFNENTKVVFAETIGNPGLAEYKKLGPFAYIAKLRNGLFRNTGACLAPQNAFLNQLGLETLGLRMDRQCSNALELAKWLEETYSFVKVNYPGLVSSPWYEIAERQFEHGYGAIVTIRVGSKENAFALIDALTIPYKLSNIGDTKTLVIHPASTISLHSTDQQRADAGVYEDLIRISVGIEDIEDLKEDFAQAIQKLPG